MRKLGKFNGFKYDPSLGSAGLYDPKTKTIIFGRPFHQVEKGLLAEEVRHFLDDVEFGLSSPDSIFRAWLKDRGLSDIPSNWTNSNIRESNKWHHRRVFTRMLKNVDQQDSVVMNRILDRNDLKSVLEAYASPNVRGRLTLTQLIDLIDKGLVGPY